MRLVIEDRPWLLGLFLGALTLFGTLMVFNGVRSGNWVVVAAALIFAVGAPVALTKAVRRVRLTLDRDAGIAHLVTRNVSGISRQTWPLSDINGMYLEAVRDEGETYRLLLSVKGEGTIPLTTYHSAIGRQAEIQKEFNKFLGHISAIEDRN